MAELSQAEVEEINVLRRILEGEAIRLAVENMSSGILNQLTVLNQRLREVHAAGDLQGFVSLNQEFYFLVFEQSGTPSALPDDRGTMEGR